MGPVCGVRPPYAHTAGLGLILRCEQPGGPASPVQHVHLSLGGLELRPNLCPTAPQHAGLSPTRPVAACPSFAAWDGTACRLQSKIGPRTRQAF